MPIACPGGQPATTPYSLHATVSGVGATLVPGSASFDASASFAATTPSAVPITVPIVGDCTLNIDTGQGASPTIQVSARLDLVNREDPTAPPNRIAVTNVTITGLTADDVSLGGSFGCEVANLGLGFFTGTLVSMLESQLAVDICGAPGPELFMRCVS